MNTRASQFTGDYDLKTGRGIERITLAAGPYLRVNVEGASLGLEELKSNGSEAKLSGDFAFEQSGGVTSIGVSNVSSAVEIGGVTGRIIEGSGALVFIGDGVAGTISGKLDLKAGTVEAGADLFLRINNTGQEVNPGSYTHLRAHEADS